MTVLAPFRLPGKQLSKEPKYQSGKDVVISLYHRTIESLATQAAEFGDKDERFDPLFATTYDLVRESTIVELDLQTFETLRTASWKLMIDQFNEEGIANAGEVSPEDYEKRWGAYPFPEKLPFSHTYIGLTTPIELEVNEQSMFEVAGNTAWLYAFLVVEGLVIAFLSDERDSYATVRILSCRVEEWSAPVIVNGWSFIVTWFLRWTEDHTTLIDESKSFNYRQKFKNAAKKMKATTKLPRPYYTLLIEDKTLDALQKTMLPTGRKVGYRHKVRASDHMRIARGPLPLDEKLEKDLKKRRYTIYQLPDELPNEHVQHEMAKRGKPPKRPGEWLAVLQYRIKEHISPKDESLPFIPAYRKVKI